MKRALFALILYFCGSRVSTAQVEPAVTPETLKPQAGIIVGTVTDVNNDPVPGANVALEGSLPQDSRAVKSNDNGFFEFKAVAPGTYRVTIGAEGFANWTSPAITLAPGQYAILPGGKLSIAEARTTINVTPASAEEIATEQVKIEEQQRIFGFIPNYYVVYDQDAAPLTTKLKFQLATKVLYNPVTILGSAAIAGINQAGGVPDYGGGAKGYAERFGSSYGGGAIDIMVGGAILPSLLHQDPRYFYRGTGTKKSRLLYAISRTLICKGDNGQWQPNYSTIGGDLAAAGIANAYYPHSDRGVGRVFSTALINTGERALANFAQEFILHGVTSKGKNQN
jgi:hypothetical protein